MQTNFALLKSIFSILKHQKHKFWWFFKQDWRKTEFSKDSSATQDSNLILEVKFRDDWLY